MPADLKPHPPPKGWVHLNGGTTMSPTKGIEPFLHLNITHTQNPTEITQTQIQTKNTRTQNKTTSKRRHITRNLTWQELEEDQETQKERHQQKGKEDQRQQDQGSCRPPDSRGTASKLIKRELVTKETEGVFTEVIHSVYPLKGMIWGPVRFCNNVTTIRVIS